MTSGCWLLRTSPLPIRALPPIRSTTQARGNLRAGGGTVPAGAFWEGMEGLAWHLGHWGYPEYLRVSQDLVHLEMLGNHWPIIFTPGIFNDCKMDGILDGQGMRLHPS